LWILARTARQCVCVCERERAMPLLIQTPPLCTFCEDWVDVGAIGFHAAWLVPVVTRLVGTRERGWIERERRNEAVCDTERERERERERSSVAT